MNGVIGKGLIFGGLLIVMYSLVPTATWVGVGVFCVGVLVVGAAHQETLYKTGLKSFLPEWMDEYLTRDDITDVFVRFVRQNGSFTKILRVMLIKFLDLSRDELSIVISGIWPQYRHVSFGNHSPNVTLLQLMPNWFQSLYNPTRPSDQLKQLTYTPPLVSPRMIEFAPNTSSTQRELRTSNLLPDQGPTSSITPSKSNIFPLVCWLVERRIRTFMEEGAPKVGKFMGKSVFVSLLVFILWRKVPRSRRPLKYSLVTLLLLYLLSITRGLPGWTEGILRALGFRFYKTLRTEGPKRQLRDQPGLGSVERVVYALLEPLIPTVNVRLYPTELRPNRRSSINEIKHFSDHPSSPSWSQASTADSGSKGHCCHCYLEDF